MPDPIYPYPRVWVQPALPASASADGLLVGDLFVLTTTPPQVWQLTKNLAGLPTFTRCDTGGVTLPQVVGGCTIVTVAGAPGSFLVTCSGAVTDTNGVAVPNAVVRVVLVGTATNAVNITATTGVKLAQSALSGTATEVYVQTDAAGLYALDVLWTAAEGGTQSAASGWYAASQTAIAYP